MSGNFLFSVSLSLHSPSLCRVGIFQPLELSQLKAKGQEQQDEPQQTQQLVPFNCLLQSAAATKAPAWTRIIKKLQGFHLLLL